MECPDCGGEMVLRETKKYRYRNGDPRKFFGCEHYPDCTATHGAHPDGTPLGIPGNKETKQWRIRAHDALKQIVGGGRGKQHRAIKWLMSMTEEEAHVAKFDSEKCKLLVARLIEKKAVFERRKEQQKERSQHHVLR